ncbi:hypothetical protein OSTOST_25527, partial [Ostertagia ostertagi]
MPLTVVTYKDLYGWTMDEIVAKIGKKNNCTFCGVFRRQALDRRDDIGGKPVLIEHTYGGRCCETQNFNVFTSALRLAKRRRTSIEINVENKNGIRE